VAWGAGTSKRIQWSGAAVPTLDDVFRKFGEAAEVAHLIETELGTKLLVSRAMEESLLTEPSPKRATDILDTINHHTLGQLIKNLKNTSVSLDTLDSLVTSALRERNRLFHTFYRQHNFRRNSDEGRIIILEDLESIHNTLLQAYKAIMLLSGIDLEALAAIGEHVGPTDHLPI
jgi:hypothetical protein